MVISRHVCPFLNGMATLSQALGIKRQPSPPSKAQVLLRGKGSLSSVLCHPCGPWGLKNSRRQAVPLSTARAMSSKRAEALVLGSLPVLGPAPREALGPEMGKASPGLQEAPRVGRAGVREPEGTGQHGCSGCGGGPCRGWGVQASWAGGGEPRKGRRETEGGESEEAK